MNWIPDPLHPAVVHFPIVLIVLGAVAALVAVFWRGGQLPRLAAVLLVLGALGSWVALETGEEAGETIEKRMPQLESMLDAHVLWAKWTLAAAATAAVLAVGSAALRRKPRLARIVAVIAALAALAATGAVYQTGHRGGALVFRHGAGVELAGSQAAGPGVAVPASDNASGPKFRPKESDRD